jgi:hypothetical protein
MIIRRSQARHRQDRARQPGSRRTRVRCHAAVHGQRFASDRGPGATTASSRKARAEPAPPSSTPAIAGRQRPWVTATASNGPATRHVATGPSPEGRGRHGSACKHCRARRPLAAPTPCPTLSLARRHAAAATVTANPPRRRTMLRGPSHEAEGCPSPARSLLIASLDPGAAEASRGCRRVGRRLPESRRWWTGDCMPPPQRARGSPTGKGGEGAHKFHILGELRRSRCDGDRRRPGAVATRESRLNRSAIQK